MDTKPWWQSKTIWGAAIASLATVLKLFHVNAELPPDLADQILNATTLGGTIFAFIGRLTAKTVISSTPPPANPNSPLMKIALVGGLLVIGYSFSGCSTTDIAKSPAGAAVISEVSNSVIDKGLNAGATKIDTGNPYLHALADGLRANEGKVLTSADVKKIASDYGDPANKSKFKTLALDVWKVIESAALQIGWTSATELAAQGLQKGATNPAPTAP
jgi:hypothetical protein